VLFKWYFSYGCSVVDKNTTDNIHIACMLARSLCGRRELCLVLNVNLTVSIQTAGLAFGGTGLCSYRVRGVDCSCAKHLTVESHTVVMLPTVILIISSSLSPLTLFIPGLKPSFSANPFQHSLPFLLQY